MTILTKYLIREIIRHLCIILGVVVITFLAVTFFERIDNFLKADVPAILAFWYFLFKIPLIVGYMLPVSLLLAILITFGLMSKRNELIALKSSGVSIFHLFKPVAALGILSAVLLFFLSEMIVPATTTRANRIWLQDVKESGAALSGRTIWKDGDNHSFFKINHYDAEKEVMHGFTAYYLDKAFQYRKRLDAKRGSFEDGRWVLEDLVEQKFDSATGVPVVSSYSRKVVNIELTPDGLKQAAKKTEEMSIKDLQAIIQKYEAEGYDATRYRVALQDKIAFPVVCLVLCLIGMAIAVRRKLKEGLPVIVSYGIGIAFLYYIVMSTCVSLGNGGMLPPVVAAWAAHAIFLCAGGVALINAQS